FGGSFEDFLVFLDTSEIFLANFGFFFKVLSEFLVFLSGFLGTSSDFWQLLEMLDIFDIFLTAFGGLFVFHSGFLRFP
ncbi:16722_t:CDS:2, partial [Dentiscutata heterogama]